MSSCFQDMTINMSASIKDFQVKSETLISTLNHYFQSLNAILDRLSHRSKLRDEFLKKKKDYDHYINKETLKYEGPNHVERKYLDIKKVYDSTSIDLIIDMQCFVNTRAIEFDNILVMFIAIKTNFFKSFYEAYLSLDNIDPTKSPAGEINIQEKKWTRIKHKSLSSNYLINYNNIKFKSHQEILQPKRVFGCPLNEVESTNNVPNIILDCIKQIYNHGIEEEGIFRISGEMEKLYNLRDQYQKGHYPDLSDEDIHLVSSLLKAFLRELPDHILTSSYYERFENCLLENNDDEMIRLLKLVPLKNRETLKVILNMLIKIDMNSSVNKMNLSNLYIIFTQVLKMTKNLLEWFIKNIKVFDDIKEDDKNIRNNNKNMWVRSKTPNFNLRSE